MIAAILYILGMAMTFVGSEETDEGDDWAMSLLMAFLWPVLAMGCIVYMIKRTFKL